MTSNDGRSWYINKENGCLVRYSGAQSETIDFEYESAAGVRKFTTPFEGVIPTLERRHSETKSQGMRDFYEMYMSNSHCETCNGARLKKESLAVKVGTKNIQELTNRARTIKDLLINLKKDRESC